MSFSCSYKCVKWVVQLGCSLSNYPMILLRFFCKELELLRTVFEEADVDGDLATIWRAVIPVIPCSDDF